MGAVALATKQGGGLKDLLRKAAKPEEAPKKGTTPVLPVADPIKELATRVKKAKDAADSAKTIFETASGELITAIQDMRAALCRREYQSAVRIPTVDNLSVTVVWSAQYTKIPGSKEGELTSIVGDRYPDYFASRFDIKVKKDLSEPELLDLIERLGADKFAAYFETEEVIKPTERFVHDHVNMDPQTKEALALADVKQYKPAIKTR